MSIGNIFVFHDGDDLLNIESICEIDFLPKSLKIYKDFAKLSDDIENTNDDQQILLITLNRSCRQMLDMKQIVRIYAIEFQPSSTAEITVEEKAKSISNSSIVIPAMYSTKQSDITVTIWPTPRLNLSNSYILTASIFIGNILFSLNELQASTYWFLLFSQRIKNIHENNLLLTLRNPLIDFYIKCLKRSLQSHPKEHDLAMSGYRFVSQLHILRCEDLFLIESYNCLIDGFFKKYHVNDHFCLLDLAAQFNERTEKTCKSLALNIYLQVITKTQSMETPNQKIPYDKLGRIFSTIAVIYKEREMYGMALHYSNQAEQQYLKHDPCSPPIDVYIFRAVLRAMLYKVTKSKFHLSAGLDDLKEIDKNERCTDRDYLFNMFVIYLDLQRYPFALDCLDRALLQPDNDSQRIIDIYRGRGLVYFLLEQFDLAIENSYKALQSCSETNQQHQAIIHVALAVIYERLENWNQIIEHLQQALLIYEQNNENEAFLKDYPLDEISHPRLVIAYTKTQNMQLANIHRQQAVIAKERTIRLNFLIYPDDMAGFSLTYSVRQV
ncbi:unnamed protein product [Adineta ricciae]|uniref:Uncharacterized protein n=1 Tax=Adineta ricciae TaxID=249248 RepID=A0A815CW20_ADIRI|nr:unnamed protein product [Adineta ricciae]CAF1586651.1 unnamed protein product [Adineta ricciae]